MQNILRLVKRPRRGFRKLQLFDEGLRDVTFNNQGSTRLLNGIDLGNKKCDRQSDKIVMKRIKLIGNVQLGSDAIVILLD